MSELRTFLESFHNETIDPIHEALQFESGSCEVAFRVGSRLINRRIVMPVAERALLSVRGLNGVAQAIRDTEPGLSDFAQSVTDWAVDILNCPPAAFEPEETSNSPAEVSLDSIKAAVQDPRALELLESSGLGHQPERRPSAQADALRLEGAALRWLLGKIITFSEDDRSDLAFVRSQHVRRALERAGMPLEKFRESHQMALSGILEAVELPYWELDELLTAAGDTSSVDHRYTE